MSRVVAKKIYKIFRSVIFSLLLVAVSVYLVLYVSLSLPIVQNWTKGIIESEFDARSSGRLEIGDLDFSPFNEVVLSDVKFIHPDGTTVISASTVGAGINLWELILRQKIQITYAELISLDAKIVQEKENGEYNIQFIIDGFKSNKEKKEPTRFDLVLNNIVIRRGNITFDREWCPAKKNSSQIDFNHLSIRNLAADLRLPRARNDNFIVDLRRLSFSETRGFDVEKIAGKFHVTNKEITFNNLIVRLPSSEIHPSDMTLRFNGYADIQKALLRDPMHLVLENNIITPSDFRAFVPALSHYSQSYNLSLDVWKKDSDLKISSCDISSSAGAEFHLVGHIISALNPSAKEFSVVVPKIELKMSGAEVSSVIDDFSPLSAKTNEIIKSLGEINLHASAVADRTHVRGDATLATSVGSVEVTSELSGLNTPLKSIKGEITTSELKVAEVIKGCPVEKTILHAIVDGSLEKKQFDGSIEAEVPLIVFNGESYTNLEIQAEKNGQKIAAHTFMDDLGLAFDISGEAVLQGATSSISLNADIEEIDFSRLHISSMPDTRVSGFISVDLTGNSIDNLDGSIEGYDLNYYDSRHGNWHLDNLNIYSNRAELPHSLSIDCDFLRADLTGNFTPSRLPAAFMSLLSKPLPDLIPERFHNDHSVQDCNLQLSIYKDTQLTQKFKLPITLLEDLNIDADINSVGGTADLNINIPYLQQGKNKLIRDSHLSFTLNNQEKICNLSLSTRLPQSKGLTTLMMESNAADNKIDTDVAWIMDRNKSYKGNVSLTTTFDHKNDDTPLIHVDVNPSTFEVNDSVWNVGSGSLDYLPYRLEVNDIKVSHKDQYAFIHGVASKDSDDKLFIDLNDINLDYIFDTLNINYVVFGGDASGQISASDLFSGQPHVYTDNLKVDNFTYNHSLLGNAAIKSWLSTDDMSIHIKALIDEKRHQVADVDGAIWLNRDSLAFNFDADKLDVGFLKPFMAAFCDNISGHATGNASLYGTFKDINLTGKVYADNVKMKIGVTNTEYTASDTVVLTPGKIHLDNITLHDREGHTALLNGYVTHEYFHNPTFKFTISEAKDFLCYDTSSKDNPIWYGTIYANGSGTITGVPGFIDVLVDMTTTKGSTFTFVIDDTEEAIEYEFLTFTDKRKETEEQRRKLLSAPVDTVPDFVRQFEMQKKHEEEERPTRYKMDLRITATPDAQAIIVMDPVAGDKIRAFGNGALRFTYNSEGEMGLYGTYTISKGSYNFTLQELIVREFKIREGSRITFTGDPLNAALDIVAAYRVNAQLTDLDKSFATDNDLNRNNVPVEALLKVSGNMQSPDITFDIDLPTLNQDVARKVRSIVSTSDMMNMQMVYLLALNRFYTPDYMNTDGSNNEMASLASATLSTQLSSILGQLVDNWSISPSFRTDKGDFSDMEVDLALSSSLLNNRLIFNGNLGYRDRATSNTTFVGDFDIEYLLNPRGTLRLKAYNHYNDQNYYLRSALTTQGLGIVYKRDFTHFLPGLFRSKHKSRNTLPVDSVPQGVQRHDSIINTE